jgi:hypothetical protein
MSHRFQNKSLHFFENVFKKPQNLSKCPTLIKKNLHLSAKFKKKNLKFFEKASHHIKKKP